MTSETYSAAAADRVFDPDRSDIDEVNIHFDWLPAVTDNRVSFLCSIIRRGIRSTLECGIGLDRLNPGQLEALHSVLARRHAGIDGGREIVQATCGCSPSRCDKQVPRRIKSTP
jgi:hypothetical protein